MLLTNICINMYQPNRIPNGAKKLSFGWKHSALNSLPGNAAWFAGWMDGNQRSSHLGKVKIILICAPGRAMFFVFLCFNVLLLRFNVLFKPRLLLNSLCHCICSDVFGLYGLPFWPMKLAFSRGAMYLWRRGCPTGLQSCIFDIL